LLQPIEVARTCTCIQQTCVSY